MSYLPGDFEFTDWSSLEPFYHDLESRDLKTIPQAKQWLQDWGEIREQLDGYFDKVYINRNLDTKDEVAKEICESYNEDISPGESSKNEKLRKKFLELPFIDELAQGDYRLVVKSMRNSVDLFCEEAHEIQSELQNEGLEAGEICGALSVELDGKQMTLDGAMADLDSKDRSRREEIYRKIAAARKTVQKPLDALLTKLVDKRCEVATMIGFDSYVDYRFLELQRFDYGRADCSIFHDIVRTEVKPVLEEIHRLKRERLGVDVFRPWDLHCDAYGDERVIPYKDIPDFCDRIYRTLWEVNPEVAFYFKKMRDNDRLDLETRKGKAPIGFQATELSAKMPFIFLNCAQALEDTATLIHEMGHAYHSFMMYPLSLFQFKVPTIEIDELASTSMEMLVLEHLDIFFEGNGGETAAKRFKLAALEEVARMLVWAALVDRFQFFLYHFPQATPEDRNAKWLDIMDRYDSSVVEWGDLEEYRGRIWQRQIHIFEDPFYYIEYGISQLGALSVWKNYKENPVKAFGQYRRALALGYRKSGPTVYETAGATFDWNRGHVRELMRLVLKEYKETAKGL